MMPTLLLFLILMNGVIFTNSVHSHPNHHFPPMVDELYPQQQPSFHPINRRGLLKSFDESRHVIVVLKDDSVSQVRASIKRKTRLNETKAIVKQLKRKQDALVGEIEMRGGKVAQQYQHALNGIRIHCTRENEQKLKSHPDVLDILPVRTLQRMNVDSVPFLGVPQVWNTALGLGFHGEGIKVGIIDGGIDYTHANFGGPGTVEAYNTAYTTSTLPADPSLFGPNAPKVKGGYDFAGDNYDGSNTPIPDLNPLDCDGHGSHVAGTVGGFGVMFNGTTFTGSYNESIYTSNSFMIGPGVAPKVDLYAYRVFGCSGGTDIAVDAIDRAIADDMDVINLSFSSDFGLDSAAVVASNNAVRAGIVVVTASGNSGLTPYITGSPGTADGAISVAAMDGVTYPGANITTVDGPVISVQNSNLFLFSDGTKYTLIKINDNPSTGNNDESLGCNVGDFPSSMPPSTLIVVNRGVCGRVQKALNGQQAGAAAVLMINNSPTGYPPYEGSVPGLSIPFFGAQLSDNAIITSCNGTQISLKNIPLSTSPTYATVTSFSSGGPRSGDSYLKPEIAAPGASIISTAVGTGYQGVTLSGTSMAVPHVAGVAALVRQAHPTWNAVEIKAAIMSTANATSIVGFNQRFAGAGLINPLAAVQTSVWAAGVASSDHFGSIAVNFGYVEITTKDYISKAAVIVNNRNYNAVTFSISVKNVNGVPHTVSFNSSLVQLDANQNATIALTLQVPATTAGNASGFYDASGTIIFTPLESGNNGIPLSVPYYIVPRSVSSVSASIQQLDGNSSYYSVSVSNAYGPIAAQSVNLFSWGIHADEPTNSTFDCVRAVGVMSMPNPNGSVTNPIIQFAVNTYKRWSSPSTVAFEILIDADPQNKNGFDYVVASIDYGLFINGSNTGTVGTFILSTRSSGYNTLDPGTTYASTDSSVMIIPLWRSFLCRQKEPCVNSTNPRFSYQITSYNVIAGESRSFTAMGWYNLFSPFITFSSPNMGPIGLGASNSSMVQINLSERDSTPALGVLVVAVDNKSGTDQAMELAFSTQTAIPSTRPTNKVSAKPSTKPIMNPLAEPTANPIPTQRPLVIPTAKPVPTSTSISSTKTTKIPSAHLPTAIRSVHPTVKFLSSSTMTPTENTSFSPTILPSPSAKVSAIPTRSSSFHPTRTPQSSQSHRDRDISFEIVFVVVLVIFAV